MKDILLDDADDLIISNGDFKIDESLTQEVGIILRLHQGELKSDPLLGPSLIRHVLSPLDEVAFKQKVQLHLARDGKDYNEIKEHISIQLNEQ